MLGFLRPSSSTRSERGSALALFALALPVMVMLVGLSIDVGHLVRTKTDEQNAADAAAVAAVNKYLDTANSTQAVQEAKDYAAKNGYSSGVTVNNPPLSGPKTGDVNAYEVIIEKDVEKFFIGLLYNGGWTAKARSVATVNLLQMGYGVITLDPNDCASLDLDSNAQLKVTGGGIYVNSECPANAMDMDSNAVSVGTEISIVGGFKKLSNSSASCAAGYTPCPKTGQNAVPDPFEKIDPPVIPTSPIAPAPTGPGSPGSCNSGGEMKLSFGSWTFQPGVYNCRVFIDSVATATFKTGTYVFKGGFEANSDAVVIWERGIYITQGTGLKVFSNAVIKDPTTGPKGVLLYNDAGQVWFDSNGRLEVTPYGSPYSNIVIFQRRTLTTELIFNSNTVTFAGAIYAKAARIYFDSNASAPLQFVAGNVTLDSNAQVIVDISNSPKIVIKEYRLTE